MIPSPKNGTLALVGAGEYLSGMDDIDRQLLERTPGEPFVVCMPTAAGKEGSDSIAYWSKLGTDHFASLGARAEAVEVIDRASAMDSLHAERIATANFVYLSGGDPHYLYRTLVGTKCLESIEEILNRGGVVAGCSAGAMIWGEQIPSLIPPPWPWRRGFNKIPGTTIIPHYDQIPTWFARIFRIVNFNRPTMVGIDSYTALILSKSVSTVIGQGSVTVRGRLQKRVFSEGDRVEY